MHVLLEREADTRYWWFPISTSRQHLEEAVERLEHHVKCRGQIPEWLAL